MADLPHEIIFQILIRVPALSLLRFRCVSKSWRSTIDSPDFIKIHLNQTIRSNSDRKLVLNSDFLYTADFDSFERTNRAVYTELDHPLKSPDAFCDVIGSCHGVLCLMIYAIQNAEVEYKGIVLWNPTTRKQLNLPPFTGFESGGYSKFSLRSLDYGFGYDAVSDDYKVLQIIQAFDAYSEVKVFSVKSNSWKKLSPFPYYMQYRGTHGLLVGGFLYWLVTMDPNIQQENFICAFNLATEEFILVPHPPANLSRGKYFMTAVVLGEYLCVTCNYSCKYTEFWLLKDYALEEPWTNMLRVQLDDFVKPVAYSSCGSKVFMVQEHKGLLWYDLKKNETMYPTFCISETDPNFEFHNVYFGSLVQLNGSDEKVPD